MQHATSTKLMRGALRAPLPFKPSIQQRHRCTSRKLFRTACQQQQVTLSLPDGKKQQMPKQVMTVGRQPTADLQLASGQVEAEHAKLEFKSGRLFATALTGDADDLLSSTRAWLNGAEMRPGVTYMVAPGATLAFGTPDNCITVEFTEQGGSNAMADMLMKGMASQATAEVRQQLESAQKPESK